MSLRESFDIDNLADATQSTLLAAHMGDWPLTLQLADRAIRHLQWGGQRLYLAGILNVVARALVASDIEATARLQGAARHLGPQPTRVVDTPGGPSRTPPAVAPPGSSLITDLRRQTSQILRDILDEGRLRDLRAEGEAMDTDQAAAYVLEAIRRARRPTAE
jgi:hypothetical protein